MKFNSLWLSVLETTMNTEPVIITKGEIEVAASTNLTYVR